LEEKAKVLRVFGSKYLRIVIDLIIILLIAVVVFRNFIFTQGWPAGGDVLGWISREYLYAKDFRWLFMWRPNSFGYPEGITLMDFFLLLTHLIGGDAPSTIKIFAFSSFTLAGFTMYAFGYYYTRKHLAALAGSLVYILNQWLLAQMTEAHVDIMFSYALAPLVFLFFDKALQTRKLRNVLISSLLLMIVLTSFHLQAIFIYGIFLGLFLIINFLRPRQSTRIRDIAKQYSKTLGIMCLLVAMLSAYVWIPLLFNVRAEYLSTGFSRGRLEDTYINGYKTFDEAFTLAGTEKWGYVSIIDVTKEVGLQILPTTTILFIVFAIAYAVTLMFKQDRYTFFFGLSALVSIIISMGPYSPFNSCFFWAWSNVPYFQTFRAISRWAMMTAFSNSFFICASVSILTSYLPKISHKLHEEHAETKTNSANGLSELKDEKVPLNVSAKILRPARKLLYYFAIFTLAAVLMSGFISTWFLFSQGLQVYTPPSYYIDPYEYLAQVPGDYKIATIGRYTDDWYSAFGTQMDFVGGMLTPIGWSHDLGYDSTFIHDKPVLQEGGLAALSRDFLNYLRFCLMRNNVTRSMLKMLGAFNYKYVVIPSYATENVRSFFMLQDGGHMIYNQSNSIILENEFWVPRIYAPSQFAVVFGGLECLSSLYDVDTFSLNKTALVLAHQADNFQSLMDNQLSGFDTIVLSNTDSSDLALMPSKEIHLVFAAGYAFNSMNASKYWVNLYPCWWTDMGQQVLGGGTLTTSGNNKVNIPFQVSSDGSYEVWIRIGFTTNRGKLLVSVDSFPIAEIKPNFDSWPEMKWVSLASDFRLATGSHTITLTNDGTGSNDIDAIAIVEESTMKEQEEKTLRLFQDFDGSILQIIEAEELFPKMLPRGWSIQAYPSVGYGLHVENGPSVSPMANASASSVSNNLEASYAIDGDPNTRWASFTGLPQWLEITWPTSQELYAVRINFEYACARDYRIQAWNGTDWTDQIVVENNTLLSRVHMFSQLATTNKLRILVTAAPAFNMVSIYDVEAYSLNNMASSEIFLPRTDEYTLEARLISDEKSNGTLFLKVDDTMFSLSSSANESKGVWHELGSTFLNAGEHNVSMSAMGNVVLDKISLHSTLNKTLAIEDLFGSNLQAPSVSYEKINPCTYVVHVNSTQPFLLTFSESYHPLWKAYAYGKEIPSIAVNSLANGFYINHTGNFDITLYFTGQTYTDVGLVISGGTTIFVIAVLLEKSIRFERLGRLIRRHLRFHRREQLSGKNANPSHS
jgi:hypothetical protein